MFIRISLLFLSFAGSPPAGQEEKLLFSSAHKLNFTMFVNSLKLSLTAEFTVDKRQLTAS